MAIVIVEEECEGCGTCIPMCPNNAIIYVERDDHTIAGIISENCVECGECMEYCLRGAIKEV